MTNQPQLNLTFNLQHIEVFAVSLLYIRLQDEIFITSLIQDKICQRLPLYETETT